MAYLNDEVLDAACNEIATHATHLYLCSQEPATRDQAVTTYALGNKAGPTFTGPVDGDVSGRKVTVDAITDGNVTATGTASHWALVDATRLLAAHSLSASQAVTSGNTFSLAAFDIEFPDPA